MLRIISNYALERADNGASAALCEPCRRVNGSPFVLSPIVGWGIDVLGGVPFFLAGAASIALGTLVAFGLPEPRNSHFNMQK